MLGASGSGSHECPAIGHDKFNDGENKLKPRSR